MTSPAGGVSGASATPPLRLTGADCFILALDRIMRRNGQHGLNGQTHVLLDGAPDPEALQAAATRLAAAFPVLNAKVSRSFLTLVPAWKPARQSPVLPVRCWREPGSNALDAIETPSLREWAENILNRPLVAREGCRNLRLDVVFLADGKAVLVLTWAHLLFDGKGAELLVGALLQNEPLSADQPRTSKNPAEAPMSLRKRFATAKPVVERFFTLARNKYRSLSGPHPKPGLLRFIIKKLDENQTAGVQNRACDFTSPLFNAAFYLACAARAHRQAFLSRGEDPPHYVVSIPVQIRRKGGATTPFQNCVTVLFFCLKREDLDSLETAAAAAQTQFEEMMRNRLDTSFLHVLEMMKLLPAPFYMRFVGHQFAGEITSFFHSFTGNFAVPLDEVFGAKVLDAHHIPAVSAPPGSGLFMGIFKGRLSVTFSWRENASSEKEAGIITDHLLRDLTGDPLP